jgi:hypothetical protein
MSHVSQFLQHERALQPGHAISAALLGLVPAVLGNLSQNLTRNGRQPGVGTPTAL